MPTIHVTARFTDHTGKEYQPDTVVDVSDRVASHAKFYGVGRVVDQDEAEQIRKEAAEKAEAEKAEAEKAEAEKATETKSKSRRGGSTGEDKA